jgi:hypothetical protein
VRAAEAVDMRNAKNASEPKVCVHQQGTGFVGMTAS